MNILIVVIFLGFNLNIMASEVGECTADYYSKRYIEFSTEETYPKTYEFSCLYSCVSKDHVEEVLGVSHITVSSLSEEGRRLVCEGVQKQRLQLDQKL